MYKAISDIAHETDSDKIHATTNMSAGGEDSDEELGIYDRWLVERQDWDPATMMWEDQNGFLKKEKCDGEKAWRCSA